MTDAMTAATWLVWNNDAKRQELECEEYGVYEGITHLKLQKLLYYAQGISLALNDAPLFHERIEAWRHGPVVNEVYQNFKNFGGSPIFVDFTEDAAASIRKLDSQDEESLALAYDNFAIFTAWQLRNMTHEDGAPWDVTVKTKGYNAEIDLNLIRDYFLQSVIESA